jgi:hypothetical protein
MNVANITIRDILESHAETSIAHSCSTKDNSTPQPSHEAAFTSLARLKLCVLAEDRMSYKAIPPWTVSSNASFNADAPLVLFEQNVRV